MTFSIAATDGTGAFGIAIASSSPAVAARCLHLRAGVGAACSQNVTDPRLGPLLLDAAATGQTADAALASVIAGHRDVAFRQLTLVTGYAQSSVHTGTEALGVTGSAQSPAAVAAGNLLASLDVPEAMVTAFEESSGDLETRLFAALTAGLAAGGEAGPVHSAGLAVVREVPWPETDLRVDWADDDPIGRLGALLQRWLPQRDDYVTRALRPATAPAYGVPGDE
ncbi:MULTISPECIES: DUF1028 domain-containing protein [Actinoplanes]|uniref:DUF1028 domain-containing protein n=1 Tax=Actinoplanes TaxID=1865 RepID=UPI0005F2826A|nr:MULTISPECIES: DUF1028 domain-containing protein [Actinoplanes]GLY08138.1 hypothetical protein Acsp01_85170 [Actinoplanes sp. NBRC 101535]